MDNLTELRTVLSAPAEYPNHSIAKCPGSMVMIGRVNFAPFSADRYPQLGYFQGQKQLLIGYLLQRVSVC